MPKFASHVRKPISKYIFINTEQKLKFFVKDFLSPQFPVDLVTFTKEFLNGKLHFPCSESMNQWIVKSGDDSHYHQRF